MNKLAVGAGRLTGIGGRFFGAPSLAIARDPELDVFIGVIGAVDMGGTGTLVVKASGGMVLVEVEASLLGGLESISIAFVGGKAVFALAAFAAAISSFGVLYPSSFGVNSIAVGF
jgi:hypothetical protein